MDQLIKKTAVVCLTDEEFESTSRFRHVEGVHEFYHITSINALEQVDELSNVIYLSSARELSEFSGIADIVNEKGVGQKWQ